MTPFDVSQISNVEYIEQLYAQYQAEPGSVDDGWRAFFAGFDLGADEYVMKPYDPKLVRQIVKSKLDPDIESDDD